MKKTSSWATILLLLLSLSFFSSCEDKIIYEESEPSANWKIINYEVAVNDWQWDNELYAYTSEKKMPELSEFIYDKGAIIGYVFWGTFQQNEVQVQLPFHKEGINITYDTSFDLGRTICFYYQNEVNPTVRPVKPINLRIVLIW